jgi:hypothetical protein
MRSQHQIVDSDSDESDDDMIWDDMLTISFYQETPTFFLVNLPVHK